MAHRFVTIHGEPVTHNLSNPHIYADINTWHTGWRGNTPLYSVQILLRASNGVTFGYDLKTYVNNEERLLKRSDQRTWGDNQIDAWHYNVPYGSELDLFSSNCGHGHWRPSEQINYDIEYPPACPNNMRVNGGYNATVFERKQAFTITWDRPYAGTTGITKYGVYWSTGQGWNLFGYTADTRYSMNMSDILGNNINRGQSIGFCVTAIDPFGYETAKPNGQYDWGYVVLAAFTTDTSITNVSQYQAQLNWWTNSNAMVCSKVEYQLNGGAWQNLNTSLPAPNGSGIITGLRSGTSYNIATRITCASDGYQSTTYKSFKTAGVTQNVAMKVINFYDAQINWSSSVAISKVETNTNNGGWITKSSGINATSGTISLTGLNSGTTYNTTVRFTARNDNQQFTKTISFTTKAMSASAGNQNISVNQARINWSSNVAIKTVEWKLKTESSWRIIQSNLNNTTGNFQATGLPYNTNVTVQVRLTGKTDNKQATAETTFKTLDIARITKVDAEWSVENSTKLTITNPANCSMQLFLVYNNVEVISRNNIVLNNGTYTLTLTEAEKNTLYTKASSDKNPTFKFVLKSYLNSVKISEDSKPTKITFPTKAWVKVNGTWKRALVWVKVGNTWKQSVPWVKINGNWKRI